MNPIVPCSQCVHECHCILVRLRDEQYGGRVRILKLKDWPTKKDFASIFLARLHDLMKNIPFDKFLIIDAVGMRRLRHPGDYTRRSYMHNGVSYKSGAFNIVERLPACSIKPDLGPQLYIAYSRFKGRDLSRVHETRVPHATEGHAVRLIIDGTRKCLRSSRSTHQSSIEKSRNVQPPFRCVQRTEYSGLHGYWRALR